LTGAPRGYAARVKGPSAAAPAPGVSLAGRYTIVRHLARGGMGDVYEATDEQLGRPVAVKVFRAASPDDRPRFDAEVLVLAGLNHPGLVQVYDAGEHTGDGFVVLELVDGPSLAARLRERGAIPGPEVAALGQELADALAYVHEQGIVHRDVTPGNVLCGSDGRPRLADFGIARLLDTTRITAAASAIGTAGYMSPEQVQGHDVTAAADIYSLGLVLLEALTGRRAFEGAPHEVAVARLVRDPDTDTGVAPEWRRLLAEMTSREPAARPSAAAVRDRLAGADHPAAGVGAGIAGAGIAGAGAGAGGATVDGHAPTETIEVGGGTTVMPAALLPVAEEPPPAAAAPRPAGDLGPRRLLWVALAGFVVGLLIVLAASSGGGIDIPEGTTTTAPVAVTTTPTTAPPTTTTAPPEDDRDDEGKQDKGRGNGKGGDD